MVDTSATRTEPELVHCRFHGVSFDRRRGALVKINSALCDAVVI